MKLIIKLQKCSRPMTLLPILLTPQCVTYFGKLKNTSPAQSLTNLQNHTGALNLRMRMRKPDTSGMCGNNKDDQGMVNASSDYKVANRTFLRIQRHCIEKYENRIFDQIDQIAYSDYWLCWKCNNLDVNGQRYNDLNVVNGFFEHFNGVFGSNLPEDEISAEHEQ